MIEILYYVFIYPLEMVMRTCLEAAFQLTRNYGMAIILLSLVVSIALLPFYYLGERWKAAEKLIRQRMKPELSSIKKHYKGQERFLLTQTVYRRFEYKPIYSLRVSFSFLIQVPFFFAAYHLLSHYEAYSGQSFLVIKDLSLPDGLISFTDTRINFLPFLMTLVNLASAFVYTKYMSRSDKLQLWALAAFFLVVLYNSPAGLVLYWTMNNLFSFLKNLLGVKLKLPFLVSQVRTEPVKERSFIFWIKERDIFLPLVWSLLWLSAYMALVHIAFDTYDGYVSDEQKVTGLYSAYITVSALILLIALMVHYFHSNRKAMSISQKASTSISLILAIAIVMLVLEWSTEESSLLNVSAEIVEDPYVLTLFVLLGTFLLPALNQGHRNKVQNSTTPLFLPILAAFHLATFIFIYQPINIYSSSPDILGIGPIDTIRDNFIYAISVFTLLSIAIISLRKIFTKLNIIIIYCAIIAPLFSMLPMNYGALNNFWLADSANLFKPIHAYAFEFLALSVTFVMIIKLLKISKAYVAYILIIVTATSFAEFCYSLNKYFNLMTPAANDNYANQSHKNNNDLSDALVFSKDENNLVIFMLDMFTGGLVEPILEENPEMRKIYQGFVWYPNTLSVSDNTSGSISALNAGFRYTPESMNERHFNNIGDGIIESYDWLFDVIKSEGYHAYVTQPSYYYSYDGDCTRAIQRGIGCRSIQKNLWRQQSIDTVKGVDNLLLGLVGFFKAVPIAIKPFIYDRGYWIVTKDIEDWSHTAHWHALKNWTFLEMLHSQSRVDEIGDTFKYFQNNLTHTPYLIDRECKISDKTFTLLGEREGSYFSARCSLIAIGSWLQWLNTIGIYDNTKIIIISDHGNPKISNPMMTAGSQTSEMLGKQELDGSILSSANALLLVKDYGSKGDMIKDPRLMSNADMAAILCNGLGGCDGIGPDPTVGEPKFERLLTFVTIDSAAKGAYDISQIYRVKRNIFDQSNWQKVK